MSKKAKITDCQGRKSDRGSPADSGSRRMVAQAGILTPVALPFQLPNFFARNVLTPSPAASTIHINNPLSLPIFLGRQRQPGEANQRLSPGARAVLCPVFGRYFPEPS